MDKDKQTITHMFKTGLEHMQNSRFEDAKALFTHICRDDPENAEAWYQLSTVNGILGHIDEAGNCSRRALELRADHCEARINLGNVLNFQGKHDEALEQYRRVLEIDPNHAVALSNVGNILHAKGQFQEAATYYLSSIKRNPGLYSTFNNLGNLRMAEGEYEKAANNYEQAIRLNPNDASLWNSLGIARSTLGNDQDAEKNFLEALRLKPDYVDAYKNLANIYSDIGDFDRALDNYNQVLHLEPRSPENHINMGAIYVEQGKLDRAIRCFQQALEIDQLNASALSNLGYACRQLGNFELYFDYYRKAVGITPDPLRVRTDFMAITENMIVTDYVPWLDEEIRKCLSIEGIKYNSLEVVAAQILKRKYRITLPIQKDQEHLDILTESLGSDDLLLMFLEKTINIDADLEVLFTELRRHLLYKHSQGTKLNPGEVKLTFALARQCLNNEYVFAVDEEEERKLANLRDKIEHLAPLMNSPSKELERNLIVYSMYDRPFSLSCRDQLDAMMRQEWSEAFYRFLQDALINPLEEEKIKREISHLTPIEDSTSQLVKSQYEENPYPRWLGVPERQKRALKQYLLQLFPHFTPPSFLDGPIRILVAGCGTGQQPITTALTFDNVDILAVDISESSLAYAIRMARKYGVENIQFMQGDILELSKLQDQFHIIECVGVLHHMEDPLKGWRVLTGLLVRGGLMKIGLYSEKARKRIVAARSVINNEKLFPDANSIRKFRQRILNHELGDLLYQLHTRPDFHSMSGCRDLIFHFQEHRFTLPQLAEALGSLNLEFRGFLLHDSKTAKLYRNEFPEDLEMTNFRHWEQLEDENSYTFPGMYNFWCQKPQ